MILAYLLLIHLLGDFILQPRSLVVWKIKAKKGLLVHVMAHVLISLIVLSPFLFNGYIWPLYLSVAIGFVHFWLDFSKIQYNLTHHRKMLAFLVDQLFHLLTIIAVYPLIGLFPESLPRTQFYELYTNPNLIISLSGAIILITAIRIRKLI